MEQINTKNERLKRADIDHRRDLDQNAEATLRAIEKAIRGHVRQAGVISWMA